jgi:acyl-CoA synthetase (AMP-forming)/AMP-acid ligase II
VAQAAVLLTGATVLPLAPTTGDRDLGFALRQSGARLLVAAAALRSGPLEQALAAAGALPALETVVVVGQPGPPTSLPWTGFRATGFVPSAAVTPDDRALLVYTSGTTAEPKGVQHTHRTLAAELAGMPSIFTSGEAEVHLAVFPPGHVAGFLGLLRFLALGIPMVCLEGWDAAVAARLIHERAVTSSVGTPAHLSAILDVAEREGLRTDSLREYMLGAATVPPALVERADARGIRAFRTYGSSEHPTISSGRADDPRDKRIGTDGRPTPGTEIRIVDGAGADVPVGIDGEILARGPEQFVGYLDPSLNEGIRYGDWLRTGDVGHLDADGFLTVTDRLKDIIVRGGENISSREVEEAVARHPDVLDAAAVGWPDERLGERVAVFVVLRPGGSYDVPAAVTQFEELGLARHKTPERVVPIDTLPRTPSGKVRKPDLRSRLQIGN